MLYADEIRRQAEAAPRTALPSVTALLWRAYGEGQITEAEAESLSVLIEVRRSSCGRPSTGQSPNPTGTDAAMVTDGPQNRQNRPKRPGVGSRPRTDASMERRRRWAASGRLPPGLAARFTLAEQGVLALVAAETARGGDCRLAIEHVAAVTGVSRSTVKNAIREAAKLGLVTVEERRVTGFRNLSNIVRIISPEWTSWLRLARKTIGGFTRMGEVRDPSHRGGGVKCATRTPTQVLDSIESWPAEPKDELPRAAVDLDGSGISRIRAGGGTGRAMR